MTHRHEWDFKLIHQGRKVIGQMATCECGEIISGDEIERRLNAVEFLSAEDATRINELIYSEWKQDEECLLNYAQTLRGEE